MKVYRNSNYGSNYPSQKKPKTKYTRSEMKSCPGCGCVWDDKGKYPEHYSPVGLGLKKEVCPDCKQGE